MVNWDFFGCKNRSRLTGIHCTDSLCGVVVLPEQLQHVLVPHDVGVVLHLDGLRVVSEVVVGGVDLAAAGVTHPGPEDALGGAAERLREPESGHAEGGLAHVGVGGRLVQRGHGRGAQFPDLMKKVTSCCYFRGSLLGTGFCF